MGIFIKQIKLSTLAAIMVLAASCGYFNDEPVENTDTFRTERLETTCKLEASSFHKILEEDISSQINCLEENLTNFTKYVRRENRDSISEKELKAFVARFFPADAEGINNSISILFDLNSILLNDEKTSISNRNIKRLSDLLKVLNREAVVITKQFKLLNNKEIDFWVSRSIVNQAFSNIEGTLIAMIDSDVGVNRLPPTMDLEKFVRKLREIMPDSSVSDLTLDLILNAKRLLVGGNKEILSYSEVKGFAYKIQRVLTVAFDIYFVREQYFNSRPQLFEFYGQKLKEIESFFFPHPAEEKIFTQASVIETIKYHLRNDENLELYLKFANETKRLMIDGGESTDVYTFGQIKLVTTLLHLGIDGLMFFEQVSPILKIGPDLTPEEKKVYRTKYLQYAQEFKERIDLVTRDRSIFPGRMEILEYGKFLNRELEILELDETFLETVFNVKKLFAGGQKEYLTWPEFQRLVERTGKIAEFYFDFATYNAEKYTKTETYKLYLDSVVSVIETLYTGELYRPILTMDDLIVVAKHLFKKDDLEAFAPTLALIKEKWIGGYGKVFTMWDVQSLLKQAQGLFEEIYFNYVSYSLYEKELSSPTVIRELEYRHHPDFGRFLLIVLRN